MRTVADEALLVPGFEHHILSCPSCHDEERRLVFIDQPAPLSAPAEMKRDLLDVTLQPDDAGGAEGEVPKETTFVRGEMLPVETLLPASSGSRPAKNRIPRFPASRVWDLKAELHRARWGLLCGRLGLRAASGKSGKTDK